MVRGHKLVDEVDRVWADRQPVQEAAAHGVGHRDVSPRMMQRALQVARIDALCYPEFELMDVREDGAPERGELLEDDAVGDRVGVDERGGGTAEQLPDRLHEARALCGRGALCGTPPPEPNSRWRVLGRPRCVVRHRADGLELWPQVACTFTQ